MDAGCNPSGAARRLSQRSVRVVPDSRGKLGGFFVNQDTILAAGENTTKFLLNDFKAQSWSKLVSAEFVDWFLSLDGSYLYCTTGGVNPKALRIRLRDHAMETIASLKNFRRAVDFLTAMVDVAPDGSLLFTRDIGTQEIYALTVKSP